MNEPVVSIQNLSVDYRVGAGTFHALSDVSLDVHPGRVMGIVGETGCGKSTLGHAIPRLLPEPPARISGGKILFQGVDLVQVPRWKLPMVRGTGVSMIFQEPLNSLNPAFRVYDQIAEAVRIRQLREAGRLPMFRPDQADPFDYSRPPPIPRGGTMANALMPSGAAGGAVRRGRLGGYRDEVLEYLRLVRINDPETVLGLYPHELSGGMRQRIMIAMALSQKPSLLIADEPTSALDVTIQAQVLTLLKELIEEVHTAVLFISHDLGVIAETVDELGVMYAGRLIELGPVAEVIGAPRHPYTKALLRATPNRSKAEGRLDTIPGSVPNLSRLPSGCRFHTRCPIARPICAVDPSPPFVEVTGPADELPHRSACHFWTEVAQLP
jgi:oligopeptide/dipeptide ABC transporter ATP-binding protein